MYLLSYEAGQTNNLKDNCTMEFSKLKHLQRYMTTFEIKYRNFECNIQIHQPFDKFQFTIEEVSETLETSFVDTTTEYYSTMIKLIVNRKFVNTFNHQYGTH